MQLLSEALTLDGELDWTGLGAATPVASLRARRVYSLAYILRYQEIWILLLRISVMLSQKYK